MGRYLKQSRRKLVKLLFLVTIALLSYSANKYSWLGGSYRQVSSSQPGLYRVETFVDGDTIVVDMLGKSETVRFIGVDTPETHDPRKAVQCFGKAAANFTHQLIGSKPVRLETDPENTNRDRYNRLLRYVYLPDGLLVNSEIIKRGYGFAYTSFPFQKSEEFKKYEDTAKLAGLGLWADCTPSPNSYGGYTSNDE